jgi:hypothetical protein
MKAIKAIKAIKAMKAMQNNRGEKGERGIERDRESATYPFSSHLGAQSAKRKKCVLDKHPPLCTPKTDP